MKNVKSIISLLVLVIIASCAAPKKYYMFNTEHQNHALVEKEAIGGEILNNSYDTTVEKVFVTDEIQNKNQFETQDFIVSSDAELFTETASITVNSSSLMGDLANAKKTSIAKKLKENIALIKEMKKIKKSFTKTRNENKVKRRKNIRGSNENSISSNDKLKPDQEGANPKRNWSAITGFIAGLVGVLDILLLGTGLFFLLAPAGFVFSILGMKSEKRGMAIAGLVINSTLLFVMLIAVVLVASFFAAIF